MTAMLDTMILVFGTRKRLPQSSTKRPEAIQASTVLLRSEATLEISAVVAAELQPMLRTEKERELLFGRVSITPLTAEHVDFAGKLAAKLKESNHLCRECLSPKGTEKCSGCGNMVSQQYRINDLHIAATADCKSGVDILYTFDTWLLDEVGPLLTRCDIRRPPNSSGELFARVEAEELAEVRRLPVPGEK